MIQAIAALRDAAWLTPGRARAWCVVLATISLAVIAGALVGAWSGALHQPLGTDFISFYAASSLALSGSPAAAYAPMAHKAMQTAIFGAALPGYYAFFYPPVFLLICLPFAMLPYQAALSLWLSVSFVPVFVTLRRVLPARWAILPILAFPAVLTNAGHGQNGFLSAGLFGAGALLLERRPFLAGLCLGGLIYKPHLLIAVPISLVAARRWRALAGVAAAATGLVTLSWLAFGPETWRSFLEIAPQARMTLETGLVDPSKMASLFAAVRILGGPASVAYALQLPLALAALLLLWRNAARRPGGLAEGALMAMASLLATPFLLSYDLTCLSLPIAWIAAEALRSAWRPWEKITLLIAYLLPVLTLTLATIGLPLAPLAMAALMVLVARRATLPQL